MTRFVIATDHSEGSHLKVQTAALIGFGRTFSSDHDAKPDRKNCFFEPT
jgi:hypothetical protein